MVDFPCFVSCSVNDLEVPLVYGCEAFNSFKFLSVFNILCVCILHLMYDMSV